MAQPGTPLLTLMGVRLEGIFPAALLPLLLTMVSGLPTPCLGLVGGREAGTCVLWPLALDETPGLRPKSFPSLKAGPGQKFG